MKEVMQRVLDYTMRKRLLVPEPFWLAKLQGVLLADCCRRRCSPSIRCGCSRPTMW